MNKPTIRVYYKQVLEGYAVPAFINNLDYHFIDLHVYENGRVFCWNFEDFDHFEKDVFRRWVCVEIPAGENLSIHGLGTWTVGQGNWIFTRETFVAYIREVIKELNPTLANQYTYKPVIENGVLIGENGRGTVYRSQPEFPGERFPERLDGDGVYLFYKQDQQYHLVRLIVFEDEQLQLAYLENPVTLSFDDLHQLVQEGTVCSEIPIGATVHIYGLGSFVVDAVKYAGKIHQKLLEVQDMIRRLTGQPTSQELCHTAYNDYLAHPTVANRANLKATYEAVPDHLKMYLTGDMDTKDIPIRMIIYGDQELENWSHYRVAKAKGHERLPSITVPKPTDGQ